MNKKTKIICIIIGILILIGGSIFIFFGNKSKIESLISKISSNNYQFSKENCIKQTLRYGKKNITFYVPDRFSKKITKESNTIKCQDSERPGNLPFAITFAEAQGVSYAPIEATEFKYNSKTYKYISHNDYDKIYNNGSTIMSESKDNYTIFCYLDDGTIIMMNMKITDDLTPDQFAAFLTIE